MFKKQMKTKIKQNNADFPSKTSININGYMISQQQISGFSQQKKKLFTSFNLFCFDKTKSKQTTMSRIKQIKPY